MDETAALLVRRLGSADRSTARDTFALMARVFGADDALLSDDYVDRLLQRSDFWAFSAVIGEVIIGGLTAHELLMTNSERTEIFIFDIAVEDNYQRRGIGRRLVDSLLDQARTAGISSVFVAADNADTHALDFYRALGGRAADVTIFDFEVG